jgi:two-component system, oxyanion-binding sensor
MSQRVIETLRIGFMPLLDAAPLVAAVRLGFDRRYGLRLQLQRQASWAAVRDKLISGELHAAHAPMGLAHGVDAGIGGPQADMAVLLTLNQNGQAITLSPSLARGVSEGRPLHELLRAMPRRPVFAQTFPTGTHALWLYYWLAALGADPLTDIDAITLPPQQMPAALARGDIDGYCAGEPWPSQAEIDASGRHVIRSGQLWPGHPEKVLACRRDFTIVEPETCVALAATVLEACRWLDDSDHRAQAATWLAEPEFIGLPEANIAADLLPMEGGIGGQPLRFFDDGDVNFPWVSDGEWFRHQFRRWGWLDVDSASEDAAHVRAVHQTVLYREAAQWVGVRAPDGDRRSCRLFDGTVWS